MCLFLRSTTKRLRSMGSQFCSYCLKICDCVRPSMAERYGLTMGQQSLDHWTSNHWTSNHWIMGQQSLDHGPAIIGSCTAACQHVKPFSLGSWLFNLVKELYSRIAVRNQLNCRGSNPSLRVTHHEGTQHTHASHARTTRTHHTHATHARNTRTQHTHTQTHTHTHTHTHTCTHTHTLVRTTRTHMHTHTHNKRETRTHMHMHIRACACIHIHLYRHWLG